MFLGTLGASLAFPFMQVKQILMSIRFLIDVYAYRLNGMHFNVILYAMEVFSQQDLDFLLLDPW